MRKVLFGIAILNDLTATALLMVGLLKNWPETLGVGAFVGVLAALWVSAGVAFALAMRQ